MIMDQRILKPTFLPLQTGLPHYCGDVLFPWKLHEMLDAAEVKGFTTVVSWLPDKRSFKVHDKETFVSLILQRYFDQTKYKSFQRQLNMWGFQRHRCGPNKGGYAHPYFVRGAPTLCCRMTRAKKRADDEKMEKVQKSSLKTGLLKKSSHLKSSLKPLYSRSLFEVTGEYYEEEPTQRAAISPRVKMQVTSPGTVTSHEASSDEYCEERVLATQEQPQYERLISSCWTFDSAINKAAAEDVSSQQNCDKSPQETMDEMDSRYNDTSAFHYGSFEAFNGMRFFPVHDKCDASCMFCVSREPA